MGGRKILKSLQAVVAHGLLFCFTLLLVLKLDRAIHNSWWALMPGDEESMSDEAIWETLPHFWVAIAMVFFIAATAFTLLKICGDVAALGWWDLFINYGVAECFAFLICTKWYNPAIHRQSSLRTPSSSITSSSITSMRYLTRNSGFLASVDEDDQHSGICSLQDIGGHVMKIPLICFQILLFMRLAGTPPSAAFIPIPVLFIPLFLLQGAGLLFSVYRLVETVILLVDGERGVRSYFRMSSVIRDSFSCMRHGSRLLGWWSIDEDSREEQARLYYAETETSGYNTFSPDTVKQMPKAKLTEEIWRLQAALCEQSDFTQSKQEEFERLQNEKILCRICFEEHINILLLPCRHHILCSTCCDKCKRCPICRMFIEERLLVNDV